MNKPKFILFLASIMFATVFTLSCSGEDGKDGTSCSLDGNILTCGDKTLVIENGVGCTLDQDELGKGPAIITCGTDRPLVIPMCNGEIYSLAKNVCDNNGNLYGIVTIGTQTWMKEDLKGGTSNKFTWAQATAAGACPNGWSLPSKADFEVLVGASDFANWNGTSQTRWWSIDEIDGDDDSAYVLFINNTGTVSIPEGGSLKEGSVSVRCIKD
ncbi:MAG: hypothetical protein LBC87_10145 [Fibromonadaceae bacterium]|jgi:hypothetical protein|nr:hypothetical protein [Fibromonadaceae bacterium]